MEKSVPLPDSGITQGSTDGCSEGSFYGPRTVASGEPKPAPEAPANASG